MGELASHGKLMTQSDVVDCGPWSCSAWVAESGEAPRRSALASNLRADVAIIGGGLTGISTALHLKQRFPDKRVVVLEAARLAHGASGRNGGQVLTGINGVYSESPDRDRRIYDVTREGVELIERLAGEYAPDAGFAKHGCLEICTTSASADDARKRLEIAARAGIPLRWLSADEVGLSAVVGAVYDPNAGRVNGVALVRGVAQAAERIGVEIYEDTRVTRVEEGQTVRLSTHHAEVRADAMVLATNAYSAALGYFRDTILPLHSHVVATSPIEAERWRDVGWSGYDAFADDLDRIAYGCRTSQGRLVFGGGSNAAYDYRFGGNLTWHGGERRDRRARAAMQSALIRYLPGLAEVAIERQWSGLIDLSFDRVCSIGVRGEHRNVYYAIGYSGHGVALSALAGRVLCDLYADHHEPWRDMPFYQRQMPRIPPEPLRWLGYQAYTRLTGRSPRQR